MLWGVTYEETSGFGFFCHGTPRHEKWKGKGASRAKELESKL
jgi:hypothetical protein